MYASKNNIEYIKLEKGNYIIKINNRQRAIILQSNITFDLNGSYLFVEKNGYEVYRTIFINNLENVKICNRKIIGDKDEHDYDTVQSSHQWGYGIQIRGSKNIQIENLELYNFTGDAIYIDQYNDGENMTTPYNVAVTNNKIFNCRRQGITIIDGDNIEITYNEIHDIYGINPQAGINLEANNENENITNIMISHNKFYNFKNNWAIQLYERVYDVEIFENEIFGTIKINDAREKVYIHDNNLINGEIMTEITEQNEATGNNIKTLIIENNKIENYEFNVAEAENIKIENNN